MIIVIIFPKIYKKGLKNVNRKQKPQGGGGLNCSNQSNNTSSGAKFFAPLSLISSVLASALCAQESVTNANGTLTLTQTNAPTVTIQTTENSSDNHFKWSNAFVPSNTPNNGQISWILNDGGNLSATTTINNGAAIPVKQLHLYFNDETSSQILIQNGTNDNIKDKIVVKGGTSATSIALDFGGKGLSLLANDSTKGTLYLNFGNTAITEKTFSITNLTTLNGNLSILGGGENNSFTVNAETINGDIIFGSGKIDADHGTITITNSLVGNITTNADIELSSSVNNGVKINFTDGATMTGSILGRTNGMGGLKKTITFSDSSTPDNSKIVLTGNIISYGPSSKDGVSFSRSSGNHVTFTKGSMVGSIIATNSPADKLTGKKGYNNITFASSSTQTLTGGILAYDYNNNGDDIRPTNTLTISANTTLQIKANPDESFNTITDSRTYGRTFTLSTGSIIARGRGANEINLANSSTLTLDGGIITEENAKSLITFTGTNSTINGNITTNAGTATINIANGASGTITGSITKSGSGANNIAYADTTGTLTLKGATNAISTLTTTQSAGTSTLNIDASANNNTTEISRVTNNYLVVNFNSTDSNKAQLTLTTVNGGSTIKDVDVTAGKNNILVLSDAHTFNISENVSIEANEGIAFDIRSGSNIVFTQGLTTADKGIATFELGGDNTITGAITNNGTHNYNIHTNNTTLTEGANTTLSFSTGENNINFVEDNASFVLKNNSSVEKAITSSSTAKTNINFNANGELSVGTATSDTATTTITVANEKSGVITGSIATTGGATNIVFGSATRVDAAPTPTTLMLKGTSNAITNITANVDGATLVLDTSVNTNETTLGGVSGDNKLTVNFNGENVDSGKTAKLTLSGNAKLKAITLGANSKNNTLAVAGGITSINDKLSVANGQKIDFEVSGTSRLIFTGGLENTGGVITLQGTGNSGQAEKTSVVGNITTNNEYAKTNLYFKDSLWAPNSTSTREGTTSGTVTVSGGESNIAVDLSGASGVTQMPIYNVVTDGAGAKNNILVKGPTHIGAQVTYGLNGETNLIFVSEADGLDANLSQATDLGNLDNGISMFGKTFSNGVLLTLKDVNVASGSSTASFLSLAGKDGSTPVFGFTTKRETTGGTSKDTVTLNGVAVGSIQAIGSATQTQHFYDVILEKNAIFTGKIALYGDNQVINLSMNEASKLFINNSALHLQNLTINSPRLDTSNLEGNSFTQNNVVIDLATDGNSFENISRNVQQDGYRVLVIGAKTDAGAGTLPYDVAPTGLNGSNGLFRVYVDPNTKGKLGQGVSNADSAFTTYQAHSDRILVNNGTQGTHYIQAIYASGTDIGSISYKGNNTGVETEGNIAVATVQKDLNITFEGATQVQGFDLIGTQLTDGITTNAEGKYDEAGAYKTYFIDSTVSKGIADGSIQTTTSALGINYDLFLANFNSLNKRMGELRDNNNGQGAWARVFVGGLSTSYGLGTQSTYTTIQAGYDYALGFEGANNYLGVALSYANALTDTKKSIDVGGVVSGIDKTSTNSIEVALYNSYVEDSGWFNDTIFKFSYMMSDVKVINQSDTYSTNNFGIVLSDEFGYRFKLGESKEWYIDPQLEVGFGYFNQSDLKQVLGQATLDGIQDAIVTLRARVGANWAYDFKNFTQGKGINASVYLGTYYSYDYISGGEISLVTDLGTKGNLKPLSSTGRFELNVGTNIQVQNNTRIYFDFEKSFGGDITTDYQVNLGVRYSFGESNGYTPISAIKTKIAPLKVSDEKPQEQPSQENTSSEEKTDTNKTEQKAQ